MKINNCYNFQDFKKAAKRALPGPVFHYIDGAADDEVTYSKMMFPGAKTLFDNNGNLLVVDSKNHRCCFGCRFW